MFYRLSLFLCGATLAAAQTAPLSLDDAIRTAWSNDPTVAALALTPELARARETQAGLRPNPELEVRSSVPAKGDSEWSVGVGVTQQIPRRERVELARAYARLGGESATLELRERRRLLAGEVRRLWYDQAVQQARLRSAQRTAALQQEIARTLQARRTAGEVADAEWDLLQLELARAEHAVTVAQAEVTGGQERLRRRLRLATDVPFSIIAELDGLIDRPFPAENDLSAARPELALADLDVRRAEAALALARGESRSDWSVGAGVDFERRANDATGRLENEPRLNVNASVPWPGGRIANRGDILEREAALKIAESTRQARRDELVAEFGAALAAARAAQPAVQSYRTLLQSASDLPRKLAPAYARGEVTGFQLAQARQQQIAIEAEFLAAAARYLSTLAEAETAAGLVPSQP
jgi:cobalt-zinc-cadmium efflux system outer membrane protein